MPQIVKNLKWPIIGIAFGLFIVAAYAGPTFLANKSGKNTKDYISETIKKQEEKIPVGETLDPDFDRTTLATSTYTIPKKINKNGLNIVFISDKFETKEAFDTEVAVMEADFMTIEPWKSYNYFNFFSIYTGEDSSCRVETENHRKPTLRCSTHINDYITKLGLYRFKAVIISRSDFTSWANLSRLDNTLVALSIPQGQEESVLNLKIFLHEFAHGFGLRDEMTKSVIALAGSEATIAGGPNCAPDVPTAVKWWGDLVKKGNGQNNTFVFSGEDNDVGFYFGCAGNDKYLKPTVGSLMNLQDSTHPSQDYGPVSERYLKKVLDYCFSEKTYTEKDDPDFFELYPQFKACLKT